MSTQPPSEDNISPDLMALAAQTREIYERNAARFDQERHKILIERPWLERFLSAIGPEAGTSPRILDMGCGAGEPVAAFLIGQGCKVTGLDFSEPMLEIARARFPAADWRFGDMRGLDLAEQFDGIVGWDSFFHLTRAEQRDLLPRLAAHLKPGGALLLTVGPEEGEVTGHVGDDRVFHSSLSPRDYEQILQAAGMTILAFVPEDPECDFHTLLLAGKAGTRLPVL